MYTNYTNHTNKDKSSFTLIPRQVPSTALGMNRDRSSFTLIELLVVLALVAILSVVVILTLNPAELLKQARDSNRLSDLGTINTALNLFSSDVVGGFMGTSSIVYVSIPDSSPTCANLGLPAIPTSTGWSYNCVTQANLRNTDGTGWIPVNFGRISSNSPIAQLPIDPTNTTTSLNYYTYVTGGSWKLNTKLESQKQMLAAAGTDGGVDPGSFETGNDLTLAPFTSGLVGWWKFDEGSGVTSTDSSGWGNDGALSGSGASRWGAAKGGSFSGSFNGVDDKITVAAKSYFSAVTPLTLVAWANVSSTNANVIFGHAAWDYALYARLVSRLARLYLWSTGGAGIGGGSSPGQIPLNTWTHIAGVIDYPNKITYLYVNGELVSSAPITGAVYDYNITNLTLGVDPHGAGTYFGGLMDDARVYKRAFSAAEVLALYNETK